MASFWKTLTGLVQKSATPDWGTLERYMAWAFGGGASASGIVVNPQTAMQSAAVYSSIKVLAESIGMLPINLYRKDAGNVNTLMSQHPLHTLLHDQPNDWQTSVEFWEMMVVSLNLRGNAYAYINRTKNGRVVEMLPLHPDMVRVNMGTNWTLEYQITMPDSTFRTFYAGEILHIRGLTLNGWMGISPIAYARESIGLALATEKFGGQLFRNGAKMGGVLEHPGKLSEDAYKRLKSSFDEAHSGENAHKTALLEEGMKFSKVSMSADDSQFLETRKYQRSEIAAIFRVPSHMINDLEKATFSNIEQMSLEFVNFSLTPWLVRIEKSIKRDLFTPQEKATLTAKFNVANLLRGDAASRSALYHNGILDGWMTRNEARAAESSVGIIFNPIEGLDLPLLPLNMTDGTDDPDEQADEAEGEKPGAVVEPTKEGEDIGKKMLEAIRAMPPAVNNIHVEQPHITVTPPNVNVTVEKGGSVAFTTDENGEIIGAEIA
jgi:HK97 family phage portal protein